jgi:predicted nucleotidyltransferase
VNKETEQKIITYLAQYDPLLIGIFGSYARHEQTEESDLDILVSFDQRLTLIDLSRITNDLSEELHIKVDLVTQKSLNPKLKPYIEKDLHVIYRA